jgi:hypothetical protein
MGRQKTYDIRSINFGEVGHPSRVLIDIFILKYGKSELSKLIRKLVFCYLSDKPEYKDYKIQMMIFERNKINKLVNEKLEKRRKIDEELNKLGIEPDVLI